MKELAIYFLLDIVAVGLVEIGIRIFDYFRNRKPDLACDGCKEVRKLYKIKGQKLYYCYKCRQAYQREVKSGQISFS